MSDVSFPGSDDAMNRYLFEYRHDGSTWGIEILARSPAEAEERIRALTWARYKGQVMATIPVPGGGLFSRIARYLSR